MAVASESESYSHMPRRFFCLLLVSLMLANQGLCFAHTHHGTGVAEPEGHASQSHFHFGDLDQHESTHNESTHDRDHHTNHSHGNQSGRDHRSEDDAPAASSESVPLGNHDASAVYGAEAVVVARDGNSVTVPSANYFAAAVILDVAYQNDDWLLRLGSLRGHPASVFDAACPIFLRTLSLRI